MKKDFLFIVAQFLLFALYFIEYSEPLYTIAYGMSVFLWILVGIGVLIILLGIINLDDNLSVFPKPKDNSSLIFHGVYKYIRHPIYTGILLVMISYGLYTGSPLKLVITVVLGIVFYFKSELEETYLLAREDDYESYKKRTGRFFPKWNQKNQ